MYITENLKELNKGPITNNDERHQRRLKVWPSRWRTWLLRLALGRRTFDYMLHTIKFDPRTPAARTVDIVICQDGIERRIEADWIKKIARYSYHLQAQELK